MNDEFATWEKFQKMVAAKKAGDVAAPTAPEPAQLDPAAIYKRREAAVARANGREVAEDEPPRSIFDAVSVAETYRRRAAETAAFRFLEAEEVRP